MQGCTPSPSRWSVLAALLMAASLASASHHAAFVARTPVGAAHAGPIALRQAGARRAPRTPAAAGRARMQAAQAAEAEDAWSLLHVVAWDGDLDKARALLEVGHPVDPVLSSGHTPLHVAAQGGRAEVAQLLLDEGKAAVDARTSEGITPLYLALQKRQRAVAELLVDRGAAVDAQTASGNSALHMAAQNGFLEEAELLLARGCDVDARTVTGHTPLHLAATYGQHAMAELLLARGRASVDAEDNTGRRPLHFAAQHSAHETVKVLLAHASSVDALSSRGLAPLDVAAYAAPPPGRPESLASVQALLEAGSSVTTAHPWNGQADILKSQCPDTLTK